MRERVLTEIVKHCQGVQDNDKDVLLDSLNLQQTQTLN